VSQMAALVKKAHEAGDAIGTYRVFVRNLVFYTGLPHTDIIHDEHLIDWLRTRPRALLVLRASEADRLTRDHGMTLRRIGELPYFDDGSVRLRMLLWPDPARDITTVVLARVVR
jgi:hypothetical protein